MSDSLLFGQDAIVLGNLKPGLAWYAGYVGGDWANFSPLVAKFGRPGTLFKSVAVNASEFADILDVESGDAVPAQAPAWFKMMKAAGHTLPGFYASLSNIPAVVGALTAAGIARTDYVLWVAHYTGNAVIEAGGEAEQYATGNVDLDVAVPAFWGAALPKPLPVNLPHYDWFPTGPFNTAHFHNLNERSLVERYDGARKHPVLYGLYLKLWLEPRLMELAQRVAKEAGAGTANPTWGLYHRGWRFQQLVHRAQGVRFV